MDPDPGSGSRLGSGFRIQKRIQSHSNKSGCLVFMSKIFWFQMHFQFSTASFGYTIQCYCGAWCMRLIRNQAINLENMAKICLKIAEILVSWIRGSENPGSGSRIHGSGLSGSGSHGSSGKPVSILTPTLTQSDPIFYEKLSPILDFISVYK